MSAAGVGPNDNVLAFEWALGLLDPAEQATTEARRARDLTFAALCARRLVETQELFEFAEVAPAPGNWAAIERRVGKGARLLHLERSVRWWRRLAAACAVGVAGLFVALACWPMRTPVVTPASAPIIALLTAPEGGSVLSVSIDCVTGKLVSAGRSVVAGPRSAELWVIPPDQVPRPLALLTSQAQPQVDHRYLGLLRTGATLAVSLEPLGGSPTGKPTGPVIVTGAVS